MWIQLLLNGKKIDDAKKINGTINITAINNAILSKLKILISSLLPTNPIH